MGAAIVAGAARCGAVVPASALLGECCSVKITLNQGSCIRLSEDKQRKRSFFEK